MLGMAKHEECGTSTSRIPRYVMETERLASLPVVDLLPNAEYRRDADCASERRIAMRTRCPQSAEGQALDESRHQKVLDLVCSEPAVARTLMFCLRAQLVWR